MKMKPYINSRNRPTINGNVPTFEVLREGLDLSRNNPLFQSDSKEECEKYLRQIEAIERELPSIGLNEIKFISRSNKSANRYDSDSGDFQKNLSKQLLFDTPVGRLELWDYDTFYSDAKKGTGTAFYPDKPEFDRVNAAAMTCARQYSGWWKPNTSMSIKEKYVTSNEIAVMQHILTLAEGLYKSTN